MITKYKIEKKYKTIFFDWDGTAVENRHAPVNELLPLLISLLEMDVMLIIVSGTTYNNIVGGKLHELLPSKLRKNLYMGLGRGAYNYGFDDNGELKILHKVIPPVSDLLKIHEVCFEVHKFLLKDHNISTDIVFSRPNYCKIDLLVDYSRGEQLYLTGGELDMINNFLTQHNISGGVNELINKVKVLSNKLGVNLKATTDAKYLEIGPTTKADNILFFVNNIILPDGIKINECVFLGDEFGYLGPNIKGNDAEMIIPEVNEADFFDVNKDTMNMPPNVKAIGGGVNSFLEFLKSQIYLNS